MQYVNKALKERLKSYRKRPVSLLLFLPVMISAAITMGILLLLTGYIIVKGIPNIKPDLFSWEYSTANVSLMPALINTVLMIAISLLISVPVGALSAVYLVEYAKSNSRLVRIIRITAETLSGIPSIVYGLFGMLFFVTTLGWGMSLLAGACTLSIMILPLIMRTAEEALKAVPASYREGSYGLGAGKLRTIFKIVLPSAMPGIIAGIILAIGRIVGESAALIYTAGTVAKIPEGKDFLLDSTRTLSVHMYALSSEGLYLNQAYATAVILLLTVLAINSLSAYLAKRLTKS
ncbi:MAG: phosphate ABC transporter permease PstA [Clostridiales bacterium]|nr:phosphate ABC transporter permease PstA [Clostridiales bacterium]NLP33546.1 phosphate ABC transporter permease PstA [Oligella ureolytica]